MRRTIILAALWAAFSSTSAFAQSGADILNGVIGFAAEQLQRDQQRRRTERLARQIQPLWDHCAKGHVGSCEALNRFPLTHAGRSAQERMWRAAVNRQNRFWEDQSLCQRGNVAACDRALAYPHAKNRAALNSWRAAAVTRSAERQRQRRERIAQRQARDVFLSQLVTSCLAGDIKACTEALAQNDLGYARRLRVDAKRMALLKAARPQKEEAPVITNAPRPALAQRPSLVTTGSLPSPSSFGNLPDIPTSYWFITLFAMLTAGYFVLRKPDPLAPESGAIVFLRNVRGMFGGSETRLQETREMLDDRELLVRGSMREAAAHSRNDGSADSVMKPGQDQIRVKIRREQVTSMTGKVTFSVNFIAELSPEARDAVRRYRFGKTILYEKEPDLKLTANIFRLLWQSLWLWLTRKSWQITVSDLVNGRTLECKDILEVLDVEERIMTASKTFAQILRAAAWFGGEELVEI